MGEEQEIELFDAYLNTELTQTEKREFELKLQEDPDLKKRFESHQLIHQQLLQVGMNEFKNELNTFENNDVIKKSWSRYYFIGVAAIAVVLISVFFMQNGEINGASLADNYFSPYPDVVTQRAESNDLVKAIQAYNSEDYEDAIEKLTAIESSVIRDFYMAESYMALGNYSEAITFYEKHLNDVQFKEIIAYHLALAYLGVDKIDLAKKFLEDFDENSAYYEKAQEVLLRLK